MINRLKVWWIIFRMKRIRRKTSKYVRAAGDATWAYNVERQQNDAIMFARGETRLPAKRQRYTMLAALGLERMQQHNDEIAWNVAQLKRLNTRVGELLARAEKLDKVRKD